MEYWLRQSKDQPLFEDVLWSRPENKRSAGKLLIIGGHANAFSHTVRAYETVKNSGIGSVRVLLPESLQSTIGTHLEDIWYCPSNKSGSFNQQALADWLDHANWADGILVDDDLGKNSEISIILEKFIEKHKGQINFLGEVFAQLDVRELIRRADSLVTLNMKELQKFMIEAHSMHAIYSGMQLNQLVEALHLFTGRFEIAILTKHQGSMVVGYRGRVATQAETSGDMWQIDCASSASVFWLQNPSRTFEAVTTSLIN